MLPVISCSNRSDSSVSVVLNSPVLPKNAVSTFELEPGFKIELVASEPLISDPVDMEIDEYGRLYVVEMHGYPLDKTGTGIIKLLSDTDGDGHMDKSIVFADSLTLPNSVMRWKKGVLVTDAPHVFYLEDTNGDGRADKKETMLTGFALSNPQHNLNSPVLGIDNWIYLAHEGAVATQTYKNEFGDTGSAIYYPQVPASPRLAPNANGRAVRFRPDQHLLETTSGNTQFGHAFDTWGHHFLVANYNHIIQEVIAAFYLKRNPKLMVSNATQSLSDHKDAAEVFPTTRNPERQLLTDVGVITSACGITYYGGNAFPSPFDKAVFVAEPVSNLVHVDKLIDRGASFKASRIHDHKEFLTSTDAWFRPVNMYVGPDGALYLVDYYRQIIEHPEWMGEEVVRSGQLYNGHDMGRIYRISSTDSKTPGWTKGLQLGNSTSTQLVAHLSNPNSWWRLNAQRLLVDRQDKNAVPLLIKMAQNTSSPVGRLHALWTLEGLIIINR
jgi:putative membrane-bound dehydrogenase-like protein